MDSTPGTDAIHRHPPRPPRRGIDQTGFDTLWAMQEKHFWYRGRHRFLVAALDRFQPTGIRMGAKTSGP
jgi:hypothetical protein